MAKPENKQARALRQCRAALDEARSKRDKPAISWLEDQIRLIAFGAYS